MDITSLSDLLSARFDIPTTPNVRTDIESTPNPAPVAIRLTDIPAEPLTWIWPGWIPAGVLTILGGHVGGGKSTVIAAIVAALTIGATLPEDFTPRASNVLILSAEDDPARIIRPRLEANNADLDRVFILNGGDSTSNPGISRRHLDLRRDADQLRAIIDAHDIRLLVIDPIGSFLRHSDRASEGAIRDALEPLMAVIAGTGVAVLDVMRVGKSGVSRLPAQRLVGSSAVPAIARSVIMIAITGSDGDHAPPDRAILQVVKTNYTLAPHPVELHMAGNGAIEWLGPASAGIDELAGGTSDRRLTRSERADAADFLREYPGETSVNAVTVFKRAKDLLLGDHDPPRQEGSRRRLVPGRRLPRLLDVAPARYAGPPYPIRSSHLLQMIMIALGIATLPRLAHKHVKVGEDLVSSRCRGQCPPALLTPRYRVQCPPAFRDAHTRMPNW